jgi:hypothetical protein
VEKASKPLHTEARMYRKEDVSQLKFEDFYLPFGGKLRSNVTIHRKFYKNLKMLK